MTDQLINFETAKLAKEKGFDEVCYYLHHPEYGIVDNSKYHKNSKLNIGDDKTEYVTAPTQSLLQKWLRESHNLYVESYHDLTPGGERIQYYTNWGFIQQKDIKGNSNVNGSYDEYEDWKTYEEALEEGLQKALKLI